MNMPRYFRNSKILDSPGREITFTKKSLEYCVCFIDIIDSTRISSKVTKSDDLCDIYSTFINTIAEITKEFSAEIVKTTGDGVIFYFPETENKTDYAAFKQVIECGMALCQANNKINKILQEKKLPIIQYRISFDYGKVEIARSCGSERNDLFGFIVNICAKINPMARSNGIVIGKNLFQILNDLKIDNNYSIKMVGEYSLDFNQSYCVFSVEGAQRDDKNSIITSYSHHDNVKNSNRNVNIMIIDDDEDILFSFKLLLENNGYNVEDFLSSESALKRFGQMDSYYDLVILDIRMPNINGLQMYNRIKSINPCTKIIFISALDAIDELVSVLPGFDEKNILKKPVEIDEFINKVENVLKC